MNERRAAKRFPCHRVGLTHAVVKPSFRSIVALLYDLSTKGVTLGCFEALRPGDRLIIDWDFDAEPHHHRNVLACVIHCTRDADETWRAGCEFQAPLHEDDVLVLIRLC